MHFWTRLDAIADRWNVLGHSFYRRWSAGELTLQDLAAYAGQYRYAVEALARTSEVTADDAPAELRAELAAHADEERGHIELWRDFSVAVGAEGMVSPTTETSECTAAWTAEKHSFLERIAVLYAIESRQPDIATIKSTGLRECYDIRDPRALAYFDVHADRDHEHAASARAILEPRLDRASEPKLMAAADLALRANWRLLDGVERITTATSRIRP